MKTETLHPVSDYIQETINFITSGEGFKPLAYFDTAAHPRATIGYGFNIEVPDYLLLVLREMGIINGAMTTTDINAVISVFTNQINNTPHTGDLVLQTNLNRIARKYYGADGFFINTTQSMNIIREIIFGLNDGNIHVQGKEARLDALLRDPITGQSTLAHNSKEYVAVMSVFYTRETLVASPRRLLANAIINDNRAEAWFEIRYNSNADGQHADRRYKEADLFGLYDSGTLTPEQQTAQAKEILRMFTRYEVENLSGTKLTQYESAYPPPGNIDYIVKSIEPASELLVTNFAMGNTIDGWVIVGKGLDSYNYIEKGYWRDDLTGHNANDLIFGEKGNDKLNGAGGNDVIYGGEGKDTLIGGLGNDTLMGGENDDTYIINVGEGEDRIEDTQGNDKVILCGKEIGSFYYDPINDIYSSLDGLQTAAIDPRGLVVTDVLFNTTVILNDDFQWGDFGTTLVTLPTDPGINNTITGNEHGFADDDHDGHPDDDIQDTAANDKIFALGGDDYVLCDVGGANWILGQEGSDSIDGELSSSCIIEGGAGSDIIIGGVNGINQLFGDSRPVGDLATIMPTLIAAGETAADSGVRGDLVAADGENNNFLFGSNGYDIMLGYRGKDLIVAGGGNDLIIGDADGIVTEFDDLYTWSFHIEVDGNAYTPVITGLFFYDIESSVGNDDVIYAGTGNDFVGAGLGDDEVYGGTGNDSIFGMEGNDFIEGGEGDDYLVGDNDGLPLELNGNDYIDGGAGNDSIWGNGGNDELFGGAGNDLLKGAEGDDYLNGEAGLNNQKRRMGSGLELLVSFSFILTYNFADRSIMHA
jgi:Ca2+-binding RTX toxin-like protein